MIGWRDRPCTSVSPLRPSTAWRADGIPLFVEMLLDSGGQLPGSLADLLLARSGQLPEGTQRVLGAAALAGARFGQRLLEAATGLGEEELSEALRPAVAAGVLISSDEGYAFRHALIRESVQASLLPGERRRWRARLAEALGADPALAPDGRAAAEIAHHWHAAGQAARALPAAWMAAAQAAGELAYAEQLVLLDRVLGLWDQVPNAAGLTGASRLAVLEQAVTAAYLAGEPERGVRLADAALAEPGARADPVIPGCRTTPGHHPHRRDAQLGPRPVDPGRRAYDPRDKQPGERSSRSRPTAPGSAPAPPRASTGAPSA